MKEGGVTAMRGTKEKTILAFFLIALGGLLGCATTRRYPAECAFCNGQPHQSHTINIDAAGNADKECAVVSKRYKDTITWNVNANWTGIKFILKTGQKCPFDAAGKACAIPVINGRAESGRVSDGYDTGVGQDLRCFKYVPAHTMVGSLNGGPDPEVMIDP
jgi:hypothetical protein